LQLHVERKGVVLINAILPYFRRAIKPQSLCHLVGFFENGTSAVSGHIAADDTVETKAIN
jgi:hypothetical protein